ncbi:MAG TPA: monomethylamine:corrinoid methyltransferase, partial [Thermoleophilia bacterium]|nr:monomethylamine:corrinoid methyltransferase [Thermoleophilia bacterium]
MSHLKMWEIMERAAEGPYCEDDEFLYDLFLPKMQEVVSKYEIKYDPATPVPADDDLADRIWKAAVEFFLAVGVHNVDTHRRILITEDELNESLFLAPQVHQVGAGHETRWWMPREVEDERGPFCIFSPDITYDEDIFLQASMAYVQEPLADGVCGPILEESIGRTIHSGTPTEMAGVM